MKPPQFLTLAEIIEIHTDQIDRYGGKRGVRDWGLLHSALAQPEGTFYGTWLHSDLFQMAAAYTFHICQNHPFIDGNKRTALAAGLIFLQLNGVNLMDPQGHLEEAMSKVASGKMSKDQLANFIIKL